MTILQRISLLRRRFSPLEERLIAAVREILPAQAQPIFDGQVAGITLVQRPLSWNEINFYRRRRGKVDWSDIPPFPHTGEFPLAEVRFSAAGKRYKATLSSIGGHIFDFAITPSPKSIAFASWDGAPSTRLLTDPLVAPSGRASQPIPSAWHEFLVSHRKRIGEWTFHDADTVRRVTLEEGEFLILAERAGDDISCIELNQKRHICFIWPRTTPRLSQSKDPLMMCSMRQAKISSNEAMHRMSGSETNLETGHFKVPLLGDFHRSALTTS